MRQADVLIVVDMQRDFMPGGSLAVGGGDTLVPILNRLGRQFDHVVLTQDWHPAGHISFASSHGLQPFTDTVAAPYGQQSLWPDHTLQGSDGAGFAHGLDLPHAELIVRKGFRPGMDSYSAFLENDHATPTGLAGYLRERGLTDLYLCGVAWDYCVGHTALDGRALGFAVTVLQGAVLGIDGGAIEAMTQRWVGAGVRLRSAGQP